MNLHNVTVVGAGTSGLITALILKKKFNQLNVRVIGSEKIGIIGVGEGSTEHWKPFMQLMGISIGELMRETDATYKVGVKFEGWTKQDFMHSVVETMTTPFADYYCNWAYLISENLPHKASNIIPTWDNNMPESGFNELNGMYSFQFHFDAFKLNNYLKKLCKKENIEVIDDLIVNHSLKENGDIDFLIGDKSIYKSDYFVDCSGFKRLLLHKIYDIPFKSYKENLPLDRAFAFPTPRKKEEQPNMWTLARRMKSGWNWKAPTQSRWGNGYVFSGDHATDDQAIEEIEKLYGENINVAASFKYEAGRLEKFWYKNCISLGISSSFIEPLEASSLGATIQQAFSLCTHLPSGDSDSYNFYSEKMFDNILDFIQLHYIYSKKDTPFWKDLNVKVTDSLQSILDISQRKLPTQLDFDRYYVAYPLFRVQNFISIMWAFDLLNKEAIKSEFDIWNKSNRWFLKDNINHHIDINENHATITHNEAISRAKLL